ncbi:protein transport protein Sec61 subunit gamma-like [Triticum aestivum]|uniref:protein transport protein Sec61 subunit gamma-like n=1 Tax=Triticum aestivum TaxID=4565 RepID=UPI001D0117F4|nr:protein transport protein Sec61 subunit gamma-like [Triticum aestivum]
MDVVDSVVDPLREFAKDSIRLIKRRHKPNRKGKDQTLAPSHPDPVRFPPSPDLTLIRRAEFPKVAARTATGFVGFFFKLIFIPINNIIVGSG